ncbi:MAG: DUF3160 domain-containing protein [bacterium]|nr:DUF3160 domain-containing protein [bacterium]
MDNQNFNQQVQDQPLPENTQTPPIMPERKSKKKIWIVSGIFSALVVIILASFFYFNKGEQQTLTPIDTEQPISIKSVISTEFAEYKPYTVDITPNADSYSLPVNLGKIENKKKFNLDSEAEKKLTEQGFVAVPSNYNQIYSIYENNTENARPNFVTTDSVLHTYHILYDYTLRNLEINKFIPDLKNLNKVLLQNALSQYSSVTDPNLKSAAKKNVAYFTVASKLLEPETAIPSDVKDLVDRELNLIENHSDFKKSPIFGYKEDYSQYVPRGHYTRNEDFKKYFKTMMWYGRMMFRIEPPIGIMGQQTDKEKGREETRQALLISLILNQAKVNQEDALTVWDRIYQPTIFFVGKADDLNIYDYLGVMKKVFGESVAVNNLADGSKIDQIIADLKALPAPKISSSFVWETEDPAKVTKGFRFMGQRFIPDSYMFQQLVFPKIQDYTGGGSKPFTAETIETLDGVRTVRVFPRGLDVAAVLGSQRAKEILDEEKDSAFDKYDEQFEKLKQEFLSLPQNQWAENLYWNWLYSLLPTLTVKGNGYPIFMQQVAWLDKDINSFLGSWAELRHDTILYAKQSYTSIGITSVGPAKPKPEDRGYVEPNAEVYARLASLAKFMREGLESRNLLIDEYKGKLTRMEEVLLTLKAISEKELTNKDLEKNDYDFIKGIGGTLEDLVTFSAAETEKITSETDTKMEVVADVHIDGNTDQVLEEGVGKPMNLLVVVKESGDLYLTSGAIFSYYEFKHPRSDRLTDEKWQQMTKPSLPSFTQSFTGK